MVLQLYVLTGLGVATNYPFTSSSPCPRYRPLKPMAIMYHQNITILANIRNKPRIHWGVARATISTCNTESSDSSCRTREFVKDAIPRLVGAHDTMRKGSRPTNRTLPRPFWSFNWPVASVNIRG
jgi:hypothetical protein